MTLRDAINAYIASQRALGLNFRTPSQVLKFFLKAFDAQADADAVARDDVVAFLAGDGRLTPTRALKFSVLTGFYRYAISRGYASRTPLPLAEHEPKKPPQNPPYVFTRRRAASPLPRLGAPAPDVTLCWMPPRSALCCCCSTERDCGLLRRGASLWRILTSRMRC